MATVLSRSRVRLAAPGRKVSLAWLGLAPFFLFAFALMLFPSGNIILGSFQDGRGQFTLDNFTNLANPTVVRAYVTSLELSLVTAAGGGLLGFLLAYAVTVGGLPRLVRSAIVTFSGVASNFAGVPLAFAFVATLGRTGFVTAVLKLLGFDIYNAGFTLYSLVGLSLCYIYFQFPLMVLIIAPSLDGLRREWREATENLGGTPLTYWRHIALPILMPSILGSTVLLFGNSFGAYATAFALTGGQINLITLQVSLEVTGDVFHNVGAGYVLSLGMIAIMALSIGLYTWLQRQSDKWLR